MSEFILLLETGSNKYVSYRKYDGELTFTSNRDEAAKFIKPKNQEGFEFLAANLDLQYCIDTLMQIPV